MNPFLKDHMDNYLLIIFVTILPLVLALLLNLILKDDFLLKALMVGLIIPIIIGAFVVGNNIQVLLYILK